MRKTALKKKYPNRGFLIEQNRINYVLKDYVRSNGSITKLNFVKHFLFNKPYINQEFQKDFLRYANQVYDNYAKRQAAQQEG